MQSFVFSAVILLSAAVALGQRVTAANPQVPIVAQNYDLGPDGSYRFNYASADGSSRDEASVVKNAGTTAEARAVQGSYSYISPEGTPVTVNYVADEDGYRATGNTIAPQVGSPDVLLAKQRQALLAGYPGAYAGAYPGAYAGAYPGAYAGAYPGAYAGAYPGAYAGVYPGGYPGAYLGNEAARLAGLPASYLNKYSTGLPLNYRANFPLSYNGNYPYNYPGLYNRYIAPGVAPYYRNKALY